VQEKQYWKPTGIRKNSHGSVEPYHYQEHYKEYDQHKHCITLDEPRYPMKPVMNAYQLHNFLELKFLFGCYILGHRRAGIDEAQQDYEGQQLTQATQQWIMGIGSIRKPLKMYVGKIIILYTRGKRQPGHS